MDETVAAACLASWPAEVLVTRPVLEAGEPKPSQFSVHSWKYCN